MTIEELKEQVTPNVVTEAKERAIEFANDYDWDSEWEAFDPIEACQDAYMAGIRYAIEKLENK